MRITRVQLDPITTPREVGPASVGLGVELDESALAGLRMPLSMVEQVRAEFPRQ